MTRAAVLLVVALVAAPPARAQLGLELDGQSATKPAKKKPTKKKADAKKADAKKADVKKGDARKKLHQKQSPRTVHEPALPVEPPSAAHGSPPAAAEPARAAEVPSRALEQPPAATGSAPGVATPPATVATPPPSQAGPPPAAAGTPATAAPGLDLAAPSNESRPGTPGGVPPARASRKRQTQPGLSLAPLDPKANAEAKARLDAAKKLLDGKDTEAAALALDAIVRDPRLAAAHDEARYQRAKALARLGLDYSALSEFDDILESGPAATRFFHSSMEWLFWLGRRLPNEQPVVSRVARHAAEGVPPTYEDQVNYILARYEFERGRALAQAGRAGEAKTAWAEARRLAESVRDTGSARPAPAGAAGGKDALGSDSGSIFARARFVDGLVAYAEGNDALASELLKEVVRLTNPKRGKAADPEVRELAFLQLARIHYQNRQNRYAIFYYSKMPWGGRRWLEGLWEASYAYYRIGDYEKTLGNLLTLQSPYFKDEYFPESYVLKAIVYYENCRYPEARRVLEQFTALYDPVYAELTRLTTRSRTSDAYAELVRAGGTSSVGRQVLKLARSDQDIARLIESIAAMEHESDVGLGERRLEFRQAALGKELHDRLSQDRAALVEEAGQRVRAKLEYERDQLRQLLAQALRIRIEVSRKEREALEGSLAKGSQVDVVKNLKYSYAVSDEHLFWPYEGEFWRDELGTYSYTLTKGCKDRLPRSPTASR